MPSLRPCLTSLAAALLLGLGGCASTGGEVAADPAQSDGGGGIQTRAIRSAPATQQASNESRPLSELNTPEAIAAREQARSRGLANEVSPAAPPAAAAPTAAAPASTAAAPAHRQQATLQKGAKVRLRSGTGLGARPSLSADTTPAVAAEFVLGPQIYNANGYWWYVSNGKEAGWVLQTDIQP